MHIHSHITINKTVDQAPHGNTAVSQELGDELQKQVHEEHGEQLVPGRNAARLVAYPSLDSIWVPILDFHVLLYFCPTGKWLLQSAHG